MRVVSAVRPVQSSDSLFGHCFDFEYEPECHDLEHFSKWLLEQFADKRIAYYQVAQAPGRKGCATIYGGGAPYMKNS